MLSAYILTISLRFTVGATRIDSRSGCDSICSRQFNRVVNRHSREYVRWPIGLSPSHTGPTTGLRPSCDRNVFESLANRKTNARLGAGVAVVGRYGKISHSKVDGIIMFKIANLR